MKSWQKFAIVIALIAVAAALIILFYGTECPCPAKVVQGKTMLLLLP